MEHVPVTDLGALMKRNGDPGLSIADSIEYTRHACEALQYVHGQQIVHRDVKPQNMILGEEGVILVDFGVARALGGEEDQGTIAVGTPRYMAPEVFAGGTVSAASDIFSLAATLWTMIIGSPPRYGDTLKLDKIAPGLSPEFKAALVGGLEMLPELRISSAASFAEAIGVPLTADRGQSLAQSLGRPTTRRRVMEAIVRTAAGMFEAAACSIALTDPATGELIYEAAWGAGAARLRLAPMTSDHYDAIVVGSGFGGSVTAYRLADAGKHVLVLERGRPYPPGSFTRSPYRARESFWDPPHGLTGMYHYWSFRGIDALVSAGLGGGSLIYANVFIRKDEKWFVQEDPRDGG